MTIKNGSTLVEVMIIVSVLLIVITALITVSTSSLKAVVFNTQKSQATKFAQEGLEIARKERDKSWSTFSTTEGPFCLDKSVDEDMTQWTKGASCEGNIDGTFGRSLTLTTMPDGSIDAIVTVSWRDGTAIHNTTLETIYTQWQ